MDGEPEKALFEIDGPDEVGCIWMHCPDARNLWTNLQHLTPRDQLKIVVADREDYEWARARVDGYAIDGRCQVLFLPVHGHLAPADLADWILSERLPVRMQLQMHKLAVGETPGH